MATEKNPPLPHERDESTAGKAPLPRGVMQQAQDDLDQGLVDTDLHGIRGIEEANTPSDPSGQAHPRGNAGQGMRGQQGNKAKGPQP
ncbi:MAG: hypothetical protein V4463_21060 [Pseudomonadota bacterium]